jgi:hypothetical protein
MARDPPAAPKGLHRLRGQAEVHALADQWIRDAVVVVGDGDKDWTAQGHRWIRDVADQRIHGTTHEPPAVRFAQERLRPRDGRPPFQLPTALVRTVARDCCVTVDTNRYSVPAAFIGREVEIQYGLQDTLRVYAHGHLIATHPRQTARYQALVTPVHIAGLPGGPVLVPRARIPGPLPEVEVRDLAVYEALAGVEA